MEVKQFNLKFKSEPWKLLVFQLLAYCHFNNIKDVPTSHLEVLALLCLDPGRYLTSFCKEVADRGLYKSPQVARNVVDNLVSNKLVLTNGKRSKIIITINPALRYVVDTDILLNYNLLAIGTPNPPEFIRDTSQ